MKSVVIVGLGYVGLPLAIRAAKVGHHVVGYDVDATRVKLLDAGESYIEDVPSEDLKSALEAGTFEPSSEARSCAGFDVAVIAAPTPLRDGLPDLSYIDDAACTLARYLRPRSCVVLESTSYPGTTQELIKPLLEERSGLVASTDFHVGYSPERIDPGNATWTLVTTPKIVSGIDQASLKAVQSFYDSVWWTRPSQSRRHVRRNWPSWWRTPSATSTSPSSTSSQYSLMTSELTSGNQSTPLRRSRSDLCHSPPALESAATACPLIPPTFPGTWSGPSARTSASWSWRTTSITTCRIMSSVASWLRSTSVSARLMDRVYSYSGSPTRRTPATRGSRPLSASQSCSREWARMYARPTRT